jgi:hypothetical protein
MSLKRSFAARRCCPPDACIDAEFIALTRSNVVCLGSNFRWASTRVHGSLCGLWPTSRMRWPSSKAVGTLHRIARQPTHPRYVEETWGVGVAILLEGGCSSSLAPLMLSCTERARPFPTYLECTVCDGCIHPGSLRPDGLGVRRMWPARSQELFMLDSGAGGVDCIFHQEAVTRLNLLVPSPAYCPTARFRTPKRGSRTNYPLVSPAVTS